MLRPGEEARILDGSWELNFWQIALTPLGGGAPVFEGPGLVNYSADGCLKLKLFCTNDVALWELVLSHLSLSPGRLVPESSRYGLLAVDEHDRQWVADRVYARAQSTRGPVMCDLVSLTCITSSNAPPSARLVLPEPVRIPRRHSPLSSHEARKSDQEEASRVATFPIGGGTATVRGTQTSLTVDVVSDQAELHSSIALLIGDSLQFVMARPMRWVIIESCVGSERRVEVRSREADSKKGRRLPPVDVNDENADAVWDMCAAYSAYVADKTGPNRHPMSVRVCDILDSATGSIDAHALTLGVAVESVLHSEFETVVARDERVRTELQKVRKAVEAIDLDETLRSRVLSSIGRLSEISAVDRARGLAAAGAIATTQVKDWGDLRHRFAHGSTDVDRQTLVNLVFSVTVLFNHLVFAAIGYYGKYTDYSDPDRWPIRVYDPRSIALTPATD